MTGAGSAAQADSLEVLADTALPQRVLRALEHQLQAASNDLGRQLQVVLRESAQELGLQAERAEDPRQHGALLDSARTLRDGSARFTTRFLQELESVLAKLRAPRVAHALEGLNAPAHGLSLVDNAEMDEGTVLGSIAARSDSRNSLALQLLGYRYGVLAGAPAFDAEHLPMGPHALCHVLRNTCHAMLPAMAARQLVYKKFEKIAIPHYPALLDGLNARLVNDGILPHLSFVPVRVRATTTMARTDTGVDAATGPDIEDDDSDATHRIEADIANEADLDALADDVLEAAAKPDAPADSGQWTISGLEDEPEAIEVRESIPAQVDRDGTDDAGPLPIDNFADLQALLGRRRALLAKLRAIGSDDRVRETLTREEVLGMLRRMRRGNGNGNHNGKIGSLADIRQTVMAQARQLHGHGVALAEADNDTFELIALFISQLHRELRPGSPGEALVERLRLPLLQLALRDQDFFVDPAHPARMLLDAISVAGAHWLGEDDLDTQWLGLLQRAVATTQEDADSTPDIFVVANHALQDGLNAAARKTDMAERRQVDAARGREKLDLARQRAAREIAELVGGRSLPRFHAILLEQAWTDVLSLALLRGGEDSVAWRDLRSTTSAIVDASVASSPVAHDPAFILRIQEALGQVGYHSDDAAAIARQLANGRVEDADLASRTELIVQLKSRTRLGEENVSHVGGPGVALSTAEQVAHAQLATQVVARWIDLTDPADDTVVRRRLAWVSPRSGHALLTNRRGQRVEGGNLEALARMHASGRLRLVADDVPPATVAWQATVRALQRIAGGSEPEGGHP